MAASTEGVLSSPRLPQQPQDAPVMGPPTPKKPSSRSAPSPSQSQSTQLRPSSSKEHLTAAQKSCNTVICCDAEHSVPVACATDCRDCSVSAPSSPCSDIHHISSACTEPTCGAASSSTSALVCSSAVVACCDDTDCPDVPSSPCSQAACSANGDCSSMTLAVPTISTCCTDEACEPELSPGPKAKVSIVCDGVLPANAVDSHPHTSQHVHRGHAECKECRGSITSVGTAEGGQLYSSFQELLDCCCCSMPPTVEQCCVAPTPYPCSAPHPSPAEVVSPAIHNHRPHSAHDSAHPQPPSDTPSSSIITNATHHTSPGRDHAGYAGSRASTASTAATPQPVSASPSSALQWSSAMLRAPTSHDKDTKYMGATSFDAVSFEDIFPGLQSWNDCMFEQPHLHSSQGGCLPPAMTLCNSDLCQTTAPHSHWMPNAQNNHHAIAMQSGSSHQDARPQLCQWGGCNERFWTVEELVAHVNHSHLARKNAADGVQTPVENSFLQATEQEAKQVAQAHTAAEAHQGAAVANNLECLWKDCHQVPMPEKLEYGTFTPTTEAEIWKAGNAAQNDKISLAILQHLLHDHLGQHSAPPFSLKGEHLLPPTPSTHPPGSVTLSSTSTNDSALWSKKRKHSDTGSSAFCSETEQLFCRWEGCSCVFDSHSALTDHIETAHVGSGKAEYECRWQGCARHASGAKFSQKQKVLRHIQTHTGDRPFKCTQCGKRFSEQNTLAQHMRTHTLERPYVCDYPGCGKAFSVAGSLTIHKRTHTGSKPFVCSFPGCGKAFAESSNLTKHVRTHTGDKPFRCEECGKCFSRPDQASRHRKTHERKRAKMGESGTVEGKVVLGL